MTGSENTADAELFEPKHLSKEQIAALYKQAREQVEGEVANAWINYLLNDDPVRKAMYETAAAKLAKLDADLERLQKPAEQSEAN